MWGANYSSPGATGSALGPIRSIRPFQSLLLLQARPAAQKPRPKTCCLSTSGTTGGSTFPSWGDEPDMAARIIPTPAMTMDVESLITRLSSGAAAVVASSSNEQLLSMLALSRRQRKPLMTGVDGTSLKLSTSSETQRQSQQLGSAAVGSSAQSSYGSARSPQPLVVVHSGHSAAERSAGYFAQRWRGTRTPPCIQCATQHPQSSADGSQSESG